MQSEGPGYACHYTLMCCSSSEFESTNIRLELSLCSNVIATYSHVIVISIDDITETTAPCYKTIITTLVCIWKEYKLCVRIIFQFSVSLNHHKRCYNQ